MAITLYKTLVAVLEEIRVPMCKIMGMGSDGTSIMTGKETGVVAKLQEDNHHTALSIVFVTGCT